MGVKVSVSEAEKAISLCGGRTEHELCTNGWERLVVSNSLGSPVGELLFHEGILKETKKNEMGNSYRVCEADRIFLRFEFYVLTGGKPLSLVELSELERCARDKCMNSVMRYSHCGIARSRNINKKTVKHVLFDLIKTAAERQQSRGVLVWNV